MIIQTNWNKLFNIIINIGINLIILPIFSKIEGIEFFFNWGFTSCNGMTVFAKVNEVSMFVTRLSFVLKKEIFIG